VLTAGQARRIAIRATGLGSPRPTGAITTRHLRKVVGQVGLVQLDSVNAVARAHELLFFSRLGPYDKQLLHDLVYRKRELYEGWLHVASLIPTEWWPLLAWRRSTAVHHAWHTYRAREEKVIDEVVELLRTTGPMGVSDLGHLGPASGSWWGWSRGKQVLESLFTFGRVAVTTRRGAFERVYDLTERVLPSEVLESPDVPEHEARRRLLLAAARSLGVGTLHDLADYHRQKVTQARPILRELVTDGDLVELSVEGWREPAYALPDLKIPRRACPDARLVSPFDPLVWFRRRNVRLFDFDYSIEIYLPEPKRVYGYYVLPYLQGDRIVARVDVRSDRSAGVLRVPAAYSEDGADVDPALLLAELRLLAAWQGCADIEIGTKGDLTPALRRVRT
jgi:uncharacterized protein YcaQ